MMLLILNIIFFLSFTAFAYLNLNDNDPWLWVPIYMSAAICCALAMFEMYYPAVYTLLCIFYLVYAGILFFAKDGVRDWITKYKKESLVQEMQATKPYIEQTREFFGLLIITGALIINYLAAINIL
jgi:Transmembrane family 220, helix